MIEHRTIKIWKSTYLNLRLLAALNDSTMMALLDGLIGDELSKREIGEAGRDIQDC